MEKMTGSEIAKGGFQNEQEVVDKFNNWKKDIDARRWLQIMMYDLDEIISVHAEKIGQKGYKSDVNITISIEIQRSNNLTRLTSVENIQVKLVTGDNGFNQVEKRKVQQYIEKWHISRDVEKLLKLYDGESTPTKIGRNPKRMFVNEFDVNEQKLLFDFFQKNIVMIVSDVIRGRGRFAAEWTLVINKSKDGGRYRWVLISINEAIQIYLGDCKVNFTTAGNIKLGNVTLQRKGGDNGADSANMLQFKANPLILFNEDTKKYSSDI